MRAPVVEGLCAASAHGRTTSVCAAAGAATEMSGAGAVGGAEATHRHELQRHQLLWLTAPACARLVDGCRRDAPGDLVVANVLMHWQQHDLPVVVRRADELPVGQDRDHGASNDGASTLAVGLPAPTCWDRRRIALTVHPAEVRRSGNFPRLAELAAVGAPWSGAHRLLKQLDDCAVDARVFGSHGWQWLTGLAYVRSGSDVDLLIAVAGAGQADAVVAALAGHTGVRIDGELMFPDGRAVAWREWQALRAGQVDRVIVKRIDGVALAEESSFGAVLPGIAASRQRTMWTAVRAGCAASGRE